MFAKQQSVAARWRACLCVYHECACGVQRVCVMAASNLSAFFRTHERATAYEHSTSCDVACSCSLLFYLCLLLHKCHSCALLRSCPLLCRSARVVLQRFYKFHGVAATPVQLRRVDAHLASSCVLWRLG